MRKRLFSKRSLWAVLLSLLVMMFLVAGCGGQAAPADQAPAEEAQQQQSQQNEAESQPSFPVTITDASGYELVIESEPQRIVSLIPSTTETAFALGLGDRIVGVSEWDNYPEEVKEKEKIGGLEINTEKVLSLEPDLVLAHVSNGEVIEVLRNLGLNVLVLDANSLEEVYVLIETMAKATGSTEQAEALIEQMKQVRDEVVEAVRDIPQDQRKKVWVEVSEELYTAGKGTFIDELITLAGADNVAAEVDGWVQMSEEKVIEKNPDVILTTYGYYVPDAADKIKQREAWQGVTAVQNGDVYNIDSDSATRPGPRLVNALKEIAQYIYPEQFDR